MQTGKGGAISSSVCAACLISGLAGDAVPENYRVKRYVTIEHHQARLLRPLSPVSSVTVDDLFRGSGYPAENQPK